MNTAGGLFPTKTRLALLQAIADGSVTEIYGVFPSADRSELDHGPGENRRYRNVTSRVEELRRAGWVTLGDKVHDHYKAPRLWVLTPAGREVLDAAGAS